jgi:fatty acid desaturase
LTAAAQLTHADTSLLASAPSASASRNHADARRYLRLTLLHTLAMYGVLAAAIFGAIPAWLLLVAVPWLYIRLSLELHELLHVRRAHEVPTFHRLAMVFDTPFGLGYREHRKIHLRHHRYGGGERDPERWQIEGGHLRAFANALTTPERSLVEWIRARGIDAPLRRDGPGRLTRFCAVPAH